MAGDPAIHALIRNGLRCVVELAKLTWLSSLAYMSRDEDEADNAQHAAFLVMLKPIFAVVGDAMLQVAFLTSFAAFPWVVKPLYGFLSDTLPIFGYRRRSYLIICGLLGTSSAPFVLLTPLPACMLRFIQGCLRQCRGVRLHSTHKAFADLIGFLLGLAATRAGDCLPRATRQTAGLNEVACFRRCCPYLPDNNLYETVANCWK